MTNRTSDCARRAAGRAFRVLSVALTLSLSLLAPMAVIGCSSPPESVPLREGPAVLPDGEFRDLQSAIGGNNTGWVGEMLAPELLPVRTTLRVDAREALARQIVTRLLPVFKQGVVITGKPTTQEQLDEAGRYASATGTVEAQVTPVNTHDGGQSLEDWFRHSASTATTADDLPPPVQPVHVFTTWRADGQRWLLTGLVVLWPDGRRWELAPVLDPRATGSGNPDGRS